jgi:hypothetical protein
MRAPTLARAALLILLVSVLAVGLPAAFAPQTFYDDFPFVRNWVELLPYNEHLVTDARLPPRPAGGGDLGGRGSTGAALSSGGRVAASLS